MGPRRPRGLSPVRTHFFTPDASPCDDFLLWVGAIEPAKRLDRVMDLAKRQGRRLVVVGEGSQSARMRKMAGEHTTFLGRVSDERLRELYRTAAAFVQLHEEDFGITVVEAAGLRLPGDGALHGRAFGNCDRWRWRSSRRRE